LIDLTTDGSLVSAVLAGFAGQAYTIGYDQHGRGVFYNIALEYPRGGVHMVDLILNTLSPLPGVHADKTVDLKIPQEQRAEIRNRWLADGFEVDQPVVGLHPGAVHPTQRWPVEYYAELADLTMVSGLAQVVLCGGPGDHELCRAVAGRMKEKPFIMPLLPSLQALAAFLSELDLFIGNNSGPLHLAAATGVRTVSFMGPTVASQWLPVGEGHLVFRQDNLPCIGCNLGYCRIKTHACMQEILPTRVFHSVETLLTIPAAGSPSRSSEVKCLK
jgi:ADP-heptose:LPS heptosyltransferase